MYQNGFIPASALRQFPSAPNHSALDFVVIDYEEMRADAARAGIHLKLNDGYRSFARQVEQKRLWTARGKPLNAATPGRSSHGDGLATDIHMMNGFYGRDYIWLRVNAHKYGFEQPAFAKQNGSAPEAWHWWHPLRRVVTRRIVESIPVKKDVFLMDFTDADKQKLKDSSDRIMGTIHDLWVVDNSDGTVTVVKRGTAKSRPARILTDADGNYLVNLLRAQDALLQRIAKHLGV